MKDIWYAVIFIWSLSFLAGFVSAEEEGTIQSEISLPIECYPIEPFLTRFKEHFEEELVFMSESVNHLEEALYHQLWVNPYSKSWTFMVSNKPRQTICVIASGEGYNNWGPSI